MDEIQKLKNEIEEIKRRNVRVEIEKAWEISLARKIIVSILTYVVIVLFFIFVDLDRPFTNAIVPTLGFIVSTFSIGVFKNFWINWKNKI